MTEATEARGTRSLCVSVARTCRTYYFRMESMLNLPDPTAQRYRKMKQ